MEIAVYRGQSINLVVKPQDGSQVSHRLNGEDICRLSLTEREVANLAIGDYITVFGKRYNLNQLPTVIKKSNREYAYDCIFESRLYDLRTVQYRDGVSGEFPLTGDLIFFVNQLVSNLNRKYTGWSAGAIEERTALTNAATLKMKPIL